MEIIKEHNIQKNQINLLINNLIETKHKIINYDQSLYDTKEIIENKKMILPLTLLPPNPLMKPFISDKIKLKLSIKKNMLKLNNQKSFVYLLNMAPKVVKPNQQFFVVCT